MDLNAEVFNYYRIQSNQKFKQGKDPDTQKGLHI